MDMISMIYNRDMISIMVYDMNMIDMMVYDIVMSFSTVYDREIFSMICLFGQVFYDNIQHWYHFYYVTWYGYSVYDEYDIGMMIIDIDKVNLI